MPTSSQAMILRSTDVTSSTSLSTITYADDIHIERPPSPEQDCERVQFDFNTSRSDDGFEGVFAYDQNTRAYRWQIYALPSKPSCDAIGIAIGKHEAGDHLPELTPSKDSQSHSLKQQSGVKDKSRPTTTNSGVCPPLLGKAEQIDEKTYRRLEELGFRRRASSSQGSLSRQRHRLVRLLKTPKTSPEPVDPTSPVPKLSIKNINKDAHLDSLTPIVNDGFHPQPALHDKKSSKNRSPAKKKSLLEEIKESVNWENRVNPSTTLWNRDRHEGRKLHNAVCFSLRDGWNYSHTEVKDLVETQLQCKVNNIQYDPVSVRFGDPSFLDRWIVTLASPTDCAKAVGRGLSVGDDQVIVRHWDDVHEEIMEDWDYAISYRRPSARRHEHIIRKFLQVH